MSPRRRVGVVYDQGAAGPAEILAHGGAVADVVLLVPDSEHNRAMRPMLQALTCEVIYADIEADDQPIPVLDGLLTFSESRLAATAALARRLGLPGHSAVTAAALTDKMRQRSLLRSAGVDDVVSVEFDDEPGLLRALDQTGLPAVIKPRRGEGSSHTMKVSTIPQARAAAYTIWKAAPGKPLVAESWLEGVPCGQAGDYVSVETASLGGAHRVLAVTGKFPLAPPFRERGQFLPCGLDGPSLRAVEELTVKALQALGVTDGVSHTEVKLTPRGFRIIEVNGRLGGLIHELMMRAAGCDMIATAVRIALAQPLPAAPMIPADAVSYQHHHLPPVTASRVARVEGVGDVRRLGFVSSYKLVPGADLAPDHSSRYLDVLCGDAVSHETMYGQLRQAQELLTFTFGYPDGSSRTVTGRELDTEISA